jgi:predicted metal-dependent hydrolase
MRVPRAMRNPDIDVFIKEHWDWNIRHLQLAETREAQTAAVGEFTEQEIRTSADQAVAIIPKRVASFARQMGVQYGGITIRNQKTPLGQLQQQTGSEFQLPVDACSSEGARLCHHSCVVAPLRNGSLPPLWAEVEKMIPDYREH